MKREVLIDYRELPPRDPAPLPDLPWVLGVQTLGRDVPVTRLEAFGIGLSKVRRKGLKTGIPVSIASTLPPLIKGKGNCL